MTRAVSWSAQDSQAAARLQASMQKARHELSLPFPEERAALREKVFAALWQQALPKITALSLDVFDTALVRLCAEPDDVFLFLKAESPFDGLPLTARQVFELRFQAELETHAEMKKKAGSVEVSLTEIYARFVSMAGMDAALVPAFVAAEERVELALTTTHPCVREIVREAELAKKSLLFVSDTYHTRAFLHRLLTKAGYAVEPEAIFASCEHRTGKSGGKLLRIACEKRGLDPKTVAHVGDNREADEAGARTAGMIPLLHPWDRNPRGADLHREHGIRCTESLLRGAALGLAPERGERAFWFNLGVETFGPLLAGFTHWLGAQLRRDKIERVFFLLRDGFILQRFYEVLREADPSLPPSALLHSSRRAFALPALGCARTRGIDVLLVSGNPRPAREFLTRLGLDASALTEAFARAGFSSPDEVVDHRGSTKKVLQLIRQPDVVAALCRRALLERKMLLRYLEQEGALGSGPTALVDVGYNGSIQKALLAVLNEEKVAHDFHGYYLGTLGGAQDFLLPHYRNTGYLFHYGEPLALSEPVSSCREILDVICTNLAGGLRTFTRGAGKIELVLEPIDMTSEQVDKVRVVHEGILAYARALCNHPLRDQLGEIPADLAAAPLIRLITRPTPQEARLLGSLEHGDGVGSQTRKPLAAFSDDSLAPDDLLASYRNAYWKQGLLALDTPAALLTRELVAPLLVK